MITYRIENKENVRNGGNKTSFIIREEMQIENQGSLFIFRGNHLANGSNATDAQCISAYLDTCEA